MCCGLHLCARCCATPSSYTSRRRILEVFRYADVPFRGRISSNLFPKLIRMLGFYQLTPKDITHVSASWHVREWSGSL